MITHNQLVSAICASAIFSVVVWFVRAESFDAEQRRRARRALRSRPKPPPPPAPPWLRDSSPTIGWVRKFGDEMEKKLALPKNRAKGDREGWAKINPLDLVALLKEEVSELELKLGLGMQGAPIIEECADVANFAMFIADVAGKMKGPESPNPSLGHYEIKKMIREIRDPSLYGARRPIGPPPIPTRKP